MTLNCHDERYVSLRLKPHSHWRPISCVRQEVKIKNIVFHNFLTEMYHFFQIMDILKY